MSYFKNKLQYLMLHTLGEEKPTFFSIELGRVKDRESEFEVLGSNSCTVQFVLEHAFLKYFSMSLYISSATSSVPSHSQD